MEDSLSNYFFLIFFGAMLLGTIGMYLKQPLLVIYVVLGAVIGPYGLDKVSSLDSLLDLSEIGIIFLLFLLGLDLKPSSLTKFFGRVASISIASSIVFFAIGFAFGWLLNFTIVESMILGISLLFSSTILGIKLLPTTVLHHKRAGEMIIGLLLVQDFLAIFALVLINTLSTGSISATKILFIILMLPTLYFGCGFVVQKLINPIIIKFDQISEFIFLLAIGWCLGIAHLAEMIGLSLETGAFIAGVSLATSPIAKYITVSLKPLRDFFLVIFFFSLGALFDFEVAKQIYLPAIALAIIVILIKPVVLRYLSLDRIGKARLSWDIGIRLGQLSEFSLLVAILALDKGLISIKASTLIQAATLLTILLSSYAIVLSLPNPIAPSAKLRRD